MRPENANAVHYHRVRLVLWLAPALSALCLAPSASGQVFVDADADGNQDGTSWSDAYVNVQDALEAADGATEIWVAEGTYYPDDQTDLADSRTATFELVDGISLYGGFSGDEQSLEERDPATHVTILDGDLGQNDDEGDDARADNSYHVVTVDGDGQIILDGFTIRGGNADAGGFQSKGGGLLVLVGTPTISDCTFIDNIAVDLGGAVYNHNNTAGTYTGCTFIDNHAGSGGAVSNFQSSPTLRDCAFYDNAAASAEGEGGALQNKLASPNALIGCVFENNSAAFGGAFFTDYVGSTSLSQCAFRNNHAVFDGGALNFRRTDLLITNCIMSGNTAGGHGGGLTCDQAGPTLVNVQATHNAAATGAGMFFESGSLPTFVNCTVAINAAEDDGGGIWLDGADSSATLSNCVLWGNTDAAGTGESAQLGTSGGSISVAYSLIDGLSGDLGGAGNIDGDPMFQSPLGLDRVPGTADDDFRLTMGSPAIDAADTTALPPDENDLDGDGDTGEPTPVDLAGEPRTVDDPATVDSGIANADGAVVDMGAFEYQPPGEDDCNGNGILDDLELQLCEGEPGCSDCNINDVLDECDILSGTSMDEDGNGSPDECSQFDGDCGEANIDWSCTENWDLDGIFPDNGEQSTFSVVLDQNDTVFLDLEVEIDTLLITDNAELRVTQNELGDLYVVKPGGILLESRMFVGSDRIVHVTEGPVVVRSGGRFAAIPDAAPGSVEAELQLMGPGLIVEPGGSVSVTDGMSIRIYEGSLVLDGSSLVDPCPGCGGDSPPILENPNGEAIFVDGDVVMMGNIGFAYDSSALLTITGSFVNHSINPQGFEFAHGGLLMAGPPGQRIEVAGEDFGPTLDGFVNPDGHSNFSIGAVQVVSSGPAFAPEVIFENTFDNLVGAGACQEALYVHTLIFDENTTVLIDNCIVYYESLFSNGATIEFEGCGALVELPACGSDSDCEDGNPCFSDSCVEGTCDFANSGPQNCADVDGNGIRDDGCVWWSCGGGSCEATPVNYADMGGPNGSCAPDGTADANDRFHALNCFSNTNTTGVTPYPCEFGAPGAYNVDVAGLGAPCDPDGVCDANDAFGALNAFSGNSPCSCPPPPAPLAPPGPDVLEAVRLQAIATQAHMSAGETLEVDVVLSGSVADLRGYQLHLGTRGGSAGRLEVVDIAVHDRIDHAFLKSADWRAYNIMSSQMATGLDSAGVAVADGAYLATFTLRASEAARGTFEIDVLADRKDHAQRSALFPTPAQALIEIMDTIPATVTVGKTLRATGRRAAVR